jgi:hypothetical protein
MHLSPEEFVDAAEGTRSEHRCRTWRTAIGAAASSPICGAR